MKCRDRQTGQFYRFIGSGYNLTSDHFVSIFAEDNDTGCLFVRESDDFEQCCEMVPDNASINYTLSIIHKLDQNVITLGSLQLLKEMNYQPNSTELIQAYRRAKNDK